jgi:hypothetical protein
MNSQKRDVFKVKDIFFKKTWVGFMIVCVCCAVLIACASPAADAAMSKAAAERIDAHSFVEIKFPQNSWVLTEDSKGSIRNLMKLNRLDKNKLDQVIVLAWVDQEYPSEQKDKLSPKQLALAKKRNEVIAAFVKSIKNVTVETHSMAQQPSTVSDWLNTQDSKIKNSLVAAGLPTSADKMKFPSKASHALIFALRN